MKKYILVLGAVVLISVLVAGIYIFSDGIPGSRVFGQQLYANGDSLIPDRPDWNLVIFSEDVINQLTDCSTEVVFASVIDDIDAVYTYNGETGLWEFYEYLPPYGWVGGLTEIEGNKEYHVHATQDCTLVIE